MLLVKYSLNLSNDEYENNWDIYVQKNYACNTL